MIAETVEVSIKMPYYTYEFEDAARSLVMATLSDVLREKELVDIVIERLPGEQAIVRAKIVVET